MTIAAVCGELPYAQFCAKHSITFSPSNPPPTIFNLSFTGSSASKKLSKMYKVVLMWTLGSGSRSIWP